MRADLNQASVVRRAELPLPQRDEMFGLLRAHFIGVTRAQFDRDLEEKDHVILVRQGARLVGFSTLQAYTAWFEGEPLSVIYSGDTIMARVAWGSTALARAWIETVIALRRHSAHATCYWLLLTSGFRTYRFLPVFWRDFWPRFDAVPDARRRRLLHHLASQRFGAQFDPAQGIVRFRQPQKLRPELAEVPKGRLADPHVACFLACNPGFADGDELACLTELSAGNLTAAGRRMLSPDPHDLATRFR
jgi:hypothetical protein